MKLFDIFKVFAASLIATSTPERSHYLERRINIGAPPTVSDLPVQLPPSEEHERHHHIIGTETITRSDKPIEIVMVGAVFTHTLWAWDQHIHTVTAIDASFIYSSHANPSVAIPALSSFVSNAVAGDEAITID